MAWRPRQVLVGVLLPVALLVGGEEELQGLAGPLVVEEAVGVLLDTERGVAVSIEEDHGVAPVFDRPAADGRVAGRAGIERLHDPAGLARRLVGEVDRTLGLRRRV